MSKKYSKAAAGTFSLNKGERIHRWYPYLEGYSSCLIMDIGDSQFAGVHSPTHEVLSDIYVEQTGHGIPDIMANYGREVFDIEENYINVTLPFDKDVLASRATENSPINSPIKLSATEEKIIELIKADGNVTYDIIAEKLSKEASTMNPIRKAISIRYSSGMVGQFLNLQKFFP